MKHDSTQEEKGTDKTYPDDSCETLKRISQLNSQSHREAIDFRIFVEQWRDASANQTPKEKHERWRRSLSLLNHNLSNISVSDAVRWISDTFEAHEDLVYANPCPTCGRSAFVRRFALECQQCKHLTHTRCAPFQSKRQDSNGRSFFCSNCSSEKYERFNNENVSRDVTETRSFSGVFGDKRIDFNAVKGCLPELGGRMEMSLPVIQDRYTSVESSIVKKMRKYQKGVINSLTNEDTKALEKEGKAHLQVAQNNAINMLNSMIEKKDGIIKKMIRKGANFLREMRNMDAAIVVAKNKGQQQHASDIDDSIVENQRERDKGHPLRNYMIGKYEPEETLESRDNEGNTMNTNVGPETSLHNETEEEYEVHITPDTSQALTNAILDDDLKDTTYFDAMQQSLNTLDVSESSRSSIENLVDYLSECQRKILDALQADMAQQNNSSRSRENARKVLISIVDKKYQLISHLTTRLNNYENGLKSKAELLRQASSMRPKKRSPRVSITTSEEPCIKSLCRTRRYNRHCNRKLMSQSVPSLYWGSEGSSVLYKSTHDIRDSIYDEFLLDTLPHNLSKTCSKIFRSSSTGTIHTNSLSSSISSSDEMDDEADTEYADINPSTKNITQDITPTAPLPSFKDDAQNDVSLSKPSFPPFVVNSNDIQSNTNQADIKNKDQRKQHPQVMSLVESLTKCQKDIIRMLITNQAINATQMPLDEDILCNPLDTRTHDLAPAYIGKLDV